MQARESSATLSPRSLIPLLCFSILILPAIQVAPGQTDSRQDDIGEYHTYDELTEELWALAEEHPDITKLTSLGKTYEGRDIWAVEVSDDPGKDEGEPGFLFMGGHHARELISVEVPLGMLVRMVESYPWNGTIKGLVDHARTWFVPMVNPDGHVYVEEGNDWRKNRRPNGDGTYGVDLNRNYGHRWGEDGIDDTSDEMYAGQHAFSENETIAIRSLVENNTINLSLSYHSKGGYILHPWGNPEDDLEEVDPRLYDIAVGMAGWMPRAYKVSYAVDFYPASGDSDDWLYDVHGILAYTIELSPGHRPDEEKVPYMASYCLDGAISAMMEIITDGSGNMAIVVPPDVKGSTVVLEGAMDHPMDLRFWVHTYERPTWEVWVNMRIELDGEVLMDGPVVFYLDTQENREEVLLPIMPPDIGTYTIYLDLFFDDPIPEDDAIRFVVDVVRSGSVDERCDIEVRPFRSQWDRPISTIIVDPMWGGTFSLSFTNNETYSVRAYMEMFLMPEGVMVSLDVDTTLVLPNSTGFASISLKTTLDEDPGRSSQGVIRVVVNGTACRYSALVPFKTMVSERRAMKVHDSKVKVGEGDTATALVRIENWGNVDETLNLTSTDPEVARTVYDSITIPKRGPVLVPVTVKGKIGVDTRTIQASNDQFDLKAKIEIEVIPIKEKQVPIGPGPLLLAMGFAIMISWYRRRGS